MEYGWKPQQIKIQRFQISEFECLDIDYEWQFDLYTNYWEKLMVNVIAEIGITQR